MVAPLMLFPDSAILRHSPNLIRQAAQLSQSYADRKLFVTDAILQAIGTALWHALNADEKLQLAKQEAGQAILPIVIASDDPAILQLPWETLCHPDYGFLGRHEGFTLSRTIPSMTTGLPDIEQGPLKILLFSSLPDNLGEEDQLQIETEQGQVLEALGQWRQSGHVVLEMPDDGRFSEFKRLLNSFKPHLVYFSGHGEFRSDPLNHHDKGYFLFENEHGDAGELVDEDQLADAFTGSSVQGVILSACQSGQAALSSLNNGLMYRLAQKGIPHVIGMRESIFDRAGIQFARVFFESLIEKKAIALALQEARRAIELSLKIDGEAKKSILAELSQGQWCLPMLLSREHDRPLINWQFSPQPMRAGNLLNESLDRISLPAQFIGRRRELRKLQREFREGKTSVLLLTGAGGIGKTALAGKLVNTLKVDGFEIFGFSAKTEHDWRDTLFQMILALNKERKESYKLIQQQYPDPAKQVSWLLKLLLEQFDRKVALFFDNLESVQDTTTRTLTDPELQLWINAAVNLKKEGLRVVLTSRWALPEWTEPIYPLGKPVYRDFLAVAQQQMLPKSFLKDSKRLRRTYEVLNGNYRALGFFAAAMQNMATDQEQVFLEQLYHAEEEIQIEMALEKVWSHRTVEEQELLRRMTAFEVPVASEGVQKLAMPDLPHPEKSLDTLLSVSLIEQYENQQWKTNEFLVSSLVRDWLEKQGVAKLSQELVQKAATYHEWLLENERQTLDQAIITHTALLRAGMDEEAHRITLDWIVGPMNRAGMYQTLLQTFLLPACHSAVPKTWAKALGRTGQQYLHLGEYDTALEYLKRSMALCREIGDKSGEGSMLNNISQIFQARGEYDSALEYLERSLALCREIGNKSGEATTLGNISQIFQARGEYDTAREYLKQSLSISQEIGDKKDEGTTLNNLSTLYYGRGEYDTALELLKRSLSIRQEIGDKSGEGWTLNNISQIFQAKGEYDTALKFLKRSFSIMQEIGDKSGEGKTLSNISQIFKARGEYDKALESLKQSLSIQQEIGDKTGEGTTLNNISQIYDARGEYDTALEYLKRSFSIMQKIGNKSGESTALNNISQIYDARGEYDMALEYLNQSLSIMQEVGDKKGESTVLSNVAGIYCVRREYDTALDYLNRSISIQQEIGDKKGEGVTLNNISQIFKARGDYDTALEYLNRSLSIQQDIGDSEGLCTTLFNLGQTHERKGDRTYAESLLVSAYRLAKQMNLSEILQALAVLAPHFGLPEGLAGWEMLAKQMDEQQEQS